MTSLSDDRPGPARDVQFPVNIAGNIPEIHKLPEMSQFKKPIGKKNCWPNYLTTNC